MPCDRTAIRKLFRSVVLAITDLTLDEKTQFQSEGKKFEPPEKKIWIRETLLPVTERLSSNTMVEFIAIIQYDVFSYSALGVEEIESAALKVAKALAAGQNFTSTEVGVSIDRCERDRIQQDGTRQFIPIRVTFRNYTART